MTVAIELGGAGFAAGWEKLHELDTGRFEAVTRANEPGEGRVEMQLDEVPPEKLSSVNTVLVRDERRVLWAGYRAAMPSGQGGTFRSVDASGRRCAIEFVDCWKWLTDRLVFPDPANWESAWSTAVDARAGAGSTVIAAYVDANAGPGALPGRQVPNLTVTATALGLNGEWSARCQYLADIVRRVADDARLVVEPRLDVNLLPHIEIREASNLTAEVVVADLADLAEVEQRDVPAASTWVLAAGGGEGTSRMFRSAGGGDGEARIEKLVEQTNAQTSNELYQYAEATRRNDGFAFYVSGRTTRDATEQYEYLTDYRLGDLVSVQVQGIRFPVPITAVTLTASAGADGGYVETPTLGVYTPDRLRTIDKRFLEIGQRFAENIQ